LSVKTNPSNNKTITKAKTLTTSKSISNFAKKPSMNPQPTKKSITNSKTNNTNNTNIKQPNTVKKILTKSLTVKSLASNKFAKTLGTKSITPANKKGIAKNNTSVFVNNILLIFII
jgi:hypothetical protein